jgi:hypothetical protein
MRLYCLLDPNEGAFISKDTLWDEFDVTYTRDPKSILMWGNLFDVTRVLENVNRYEEIAEVMEDVYIISCAEDEIDILHEML